MTLRVMETQGPRLDHRPSPYATTTYGTTTYGTTRRTSCQTCLRPGNLSSGRTPSAYPTLMARPRGSFRVRSTGPRSGHLESWPRTRNPSFIVLSGDGRRLYAVNETVNFEDRPGGGVSAFSRVSRYRGAGVAQHKAVRRCGACPSRARPDREVRFGSELPLRVGSGFRPRGRRAAGHHDCSHPARGDQPAPGAPERPPCPLVIFDPRTGDLLVPDLGIDAVRVYTLTQSGELVGQPDRRLPVARGGPSPPRFSSRRRFPFRGERARQHLGCFAARRGRFRGYQHGQHSA